ncbi:MAG: lactate racemase domain-containing protein [Fimbriiglobus sp.]
MTTRIELPVGRALWPLTVRPDALVRPLPPAAEPADARALVRAALESPVGLNAPFRRALTPDDHVAVVIDPRLPGIADLVAGVLEQLVAAGVDLAAVTLLAPPGSSDGWLADLPDEFGDVTLEAHDPADRKKLGYVASTKAGRRVYLNRAIVDADATVVLTGRGYDPLLGHAGGELALFPGMSDTETRAALAGKFNPNPPGAKKSAAAVEAAEVLWLFGMPLFVQVIPGPGDSVADVIATLPDLVAEGVRRHDARWRVEVGERPDLVIAAVAGNPERTDFAALAAAAACAARVVKLGGRIAVLTTASPALPAAAELLRKADDPSDPARMLLKKGTDDAAAALLWAFAAQAGSLYLSSGWPDELAEELFATPISGPADVQRLIDAAERVLVLPDADKTMAEVV